jgi:hypothetical protein
VVKDAGRVAPEQVRLLEADALDRDLYHALETTVPVSANGRR